LRLSYASSGDKQRPQQYSSQPLHAACAHSTSPAPREGLLANFATWDTDRRKTRSNDTLLKTIGRAAIAHRISRQ
jgi:hypothetical protein